MPVLYRFESDLNLIITTHVGLVADEEFQTSYRKMFSDPSFERSMNILVDLRLTKSNARTPNALQKFSGLVKKLFKGFNADKKPKVAVIATEIFSFGLARMCEAYVANIAWDFLVFKSEKEACVWLQLPENILDNN